MRLLQPQLHFIFNIIVQLFQSLNATLLNRQEAHLTINFLPV